jgi:hypothetical protein
VGGLLSVPRLKSIKKGASFADVAAIQESVTAVLRSFPKEAFADSFQKLYERCQQCVVRDGDYFMANKVNLFVSSILFVFSYHSPNFLDTPRTFTTPQHRNLRQLNLHCFSSNVYLKSNYYAVSNLKHDISEVIRIDTQEIGI